MKDSQSEARTLIGLARSAIADQLNVAIDEPTIAGNPWLEREAATFVTLTVNDQLRG